MSYIPNTDADRKKMLGEIGVAGVSDLFSDLPSKLTETSAPNIPAPMDELSLIEEMKKAGKDNLPAGSMISFLGAGAYKHFIPSVVNNIITRSEFYTAYTPYQPEMSQGLLQTVYEYQTMICRLTGMDISNASHYDGATALAEACFIACAKTGRKEIVVPAALNPAYRRVLATYAEGAGIMLKTAGFKDFKTDVGDLKKAVSEETAAVVMQTPNFFGSIEEAAEIEKIAHSKGSLLIASVDPISLGLLRSPGEYGADIAVAEGQPLGMPLNFGGPFLGIFAVKKELARLLPGRVVGMTRDHGCNRGFVLTLQTREQHIRREKASSNICSNQALCALAACVYLAALGKYGLKNIASLCLERASYARKKIGALKGFNVDESTPVFKEFVVKVEGSPEKINEGLLQKGIIGGYDLGKDYPEHKGCMLFCTTEMNSLKDIDMLASALKDV